MDISDTLFSPGRLAAFLKQEGLSLKKRFGQNFLADRNMALKILKHVPFQDRSVIEIGPGLGHITHLYRDLAGEVLLVEVDRGLCRILQKQPGKKENTLLVNADFLKLDLWPYLKKDRAYLFFSNLPYRTAAPILVRLLGYYPLIGELYIMLPELYRTRLMSPDGVLGNRLGVLLNFHFRITRLFSVKKGSFFPEPELDSIFLKLTPEPERLAGISDPSGLPRILALLFSQKRKMLKNVLKKAPDPERIRKYFPRRIGELNLEEIAEIVNAYQQGKNG